MADVRSWQHLSGLFAFGVGGRTHAHKTAKGILH